MKNDSADSPLLKICHKSFASHPFLIIMCHFEVFLIVSNAKKKPT